MYLDLQAYPAASPSVCVHQHRHVAGHLAGDAAVLDVDAPKLHWRYLVEGQRLHSMPSWIGTVLGSWQGMLVTSTISVRVNSQGCAFQNLCCYCLSAFALEAYTSTGVWHRCSLQALTIQGLQSQHVYVQ